MRCAHKFVAYPVTGKQLTARGEIEVLINWRVRCRDCHKDAKAGDRIIEIAASWYKELFPKPQKVDFILQETADESPQP